jgi:hypothetical protein
MVFFARLARAISYNPLSAKALSEELAATIIASAGLIYSPFTSFSFSKFFNALLAALAPI